MDNELRKQAIQRMLDEQRQHQRELKALEGSVMLTPGENLENQLSPENLALGMGMGGIDRVGAEATGLGRIGQNFGADVVSGAKNVYSKLRGLISPQGAEQVLHSPVDPNEFHRVVSEASGLRPDIAKNVTQYTPEEYEGMKTYLSPDKKSGYAIKPNRDDPYGELVNVFSSEKGLNRGDQIIKEALGNGANKLDAFDGYLPQKYGQHGFQEIRREPNYTPGQPDVVYMQHPDPKPFRRTMDAISQSKESPRLPSELEPKYNYTNESPQYTPDEVDRAVERDSLNNQMENDKRNSQNIDEDTIPDIKKRKK